MNRRVKLIATLLCVGNTVVLGQQTRSMVPRSITLREAVDLALKHNHVVRIAASAVDEKRSAKDVARSSYFPGTFATTAASCTLPILSSLRFLLGVLAPREEI